VTVKLTREEREIITAFAQARGIARGQWIRDVLLTEIERASQSRDITLAEILGVRLLLVNVLRRFATGQKLSLEAFDKLLDEISTAKHELAGKLTAERRR
jgi:hypothetical protein